MKSPKSRSLKRKAANADDASPCKLKKAKSSSSAETFSSPNAPVEDDASRRKSRSSEKKRSSKSKTCLEKTPGSPNKRKSLSKGEKENDLSEKAHNNSFERPTRKRLDQVLKHVKVHSNIPRRNVIRSDSEESSSSSSDEDIDYVLNSLKKYGVKTDFPLLRKSETDRKPRKKDETQKSKVPEGRESAADEVSRSPIGSRKRSRSGDDEESSKSKKRTLTPIKETDGGAEPRENVDAPQPKLLQQIKQSWVRITEDDVKSAMERVKSGVESGYESPVKDPSESDDVCATTTTPKTARKSKSRFGTPRRITREEIERLETTPRRKCRKSLDEAPSPGGRRTLRGGSSTKKSSEGDDPLRTPTAKIVPAEPTTPLEKARTSLHVSAVPDSLPCREREFKNIFSFVENKLVDGIGGCMYISGVPGTGKTATVTQVVRKLRGMANQGEVPDFKYIEINGMRLADPRQAYILLWHGLSGKKERMSVDQAHRKLDAWFGKNGHVKTPTLLLIDELDLICTRKQEVVYNLLDWPTKSPSRLVVLAIANTMDMPERLFKGRVTSRLGLTRLTFLPYTYKQLEEIIAMRLTGLNAFTVDAVRLVTRKVAAVSGDARRSLDICRRATELPAPDETVKICHIEQAIREMTNSNSVKVIRSCSAVEKLFLRSVSEVSTRTGIEEVDMRDVMDHFNALSTLEGFSRLPASSILLISHRLKCFRLIFINQLQRSAGIMQRLTLNVSQDDVHYGLKCDA